MRLPASKSEVPIGAMIICGDEIVAAAHNETSVRTTPPTVPAFLAIERALEALDRDRVTDCTLYVTIEPCALCTGVIVLAKVGKLAVRGVRREGLDVRIAGRPRAASAAES